MRYLIGSLLAVSVVVSACRTPKPISVVKGGEDDSGDSLDDGGAGSMESYIDQARRMLLIVGKATGSPESRNLCAGECHGVDPDTVRKWATKTDALYECMNATDSVALDSDPESKKKRALAKIECMKTSPTSPTYATGKFGFARAAAHLDEFKGIFADAFGDAYEVEYGKFVKKVAMPPASADPATRMQADEWDHVLSWARYVGVASEFAGLDEAFAIQVSEATSCTESISDAMVQHVKVMAEEGWAAKNKALGLPMFACQKGGCFEQTDASGAPTFPIAQQTAFGKTWTPAGAAFKLRFLRQLAAGSSYWMRSSADGRFVGNGGAIAEGDEGFSTIEDLLSKDRPRISVAAAYDPGFFPDNKGWTFHGARTADGGDSATFCSQRLLEDPSVKFVNPAEQTRWCAASGLDVYHHIGASLDGSGYYVLRSNNYTNDNGGYDAVSDPSVAVFSTLFAKVEIWPMHASGETFKVDEQPIVVKVPFEGDWSIAPSATLAASRIAGGTKQQGYRLRKIEGEAPDLKLTELATVCMPGGKATFSFDERFMAVHHYVADGDAQELGFASEQDPAFRALVSNASNVYIYDFLKRKRTRVTNMGPGQFALYPHFRSDGWMHFLVRAVDDSGDGKDYVMASDAALVEAVMP